MKLIDMTCPSCGADMKIHENSNKICCDYCGKTYVLEEDLQDHPEKQQDPLHNSAYKEIHNENKENISEKNKHILVESIDSQKIGHPKPQENLNVEPSTIPSVHSPKAIKPTDESESSKNDKSRILILAIFSIFFTIACILSPYIQEHNYHAKAFAKGIEIFEQKHKNIFDGKVIFDSLYLKDVSYDYHYEINQILSSWDKCVIDITIDNFQSNQIRNYLTYDYNSEASKMLFDSINSFRDALDKNGGYIRETYEYYGQTIEFRIVNYNYEKGGCLYTIYDSTKNSYQYCDYGSYNHLRVNDIDVYLKKYK